jgi:hypothetical protein
MPWACLCHVVNVQTQVRTVPGVLICSLCLGATGRPTWYVKPDKKSHKVLAHSCHGLFRVLSLPFRCHVRLQWVMAMLSLAYCAQHHQCHCTARRLYC